MTALAESLRGLSDAEARVLLLALPAERLGSIARALDDEALYVLVHGASEEGGAEATEKRSRTGGIRSLPGQEPAAPAGAKRRGGPRAGASRKGRVEALLAYIAERPGSPTMQIARDLGYSCSNSAASAAVTLRRLVAEGQLRREARREGRRTLAYWYPAGRAKSASPRKAAPAAEEEE